MDFYREQILDHYKHPRNFGKLEKASVIASDNLVSCGDKMEMSIIVKNYKISEIKFWGVGCAISMSSASMLTEKAKNQSLNVLQSLSKDDILKMLGITLTPTRLKCALLPLEVLHKAINKLENA